MIWAFLQYVCIMMPPIIPPPKFWCHQRYQASTALQSILFKTRSIHSRSAECHVDKPIGSMYGIFNNIYHKKHLNVGKYTIHGFNGKWWCDFLYCLRFFFWSRTPICVSRNWSPVGNFPEMVSWTSLPLRQVKDTTGGTGNLPLSHTVHRFTGRFGVPSMWPKRIMEGLKKTVPSCLLYSLLCYKMLLGSKYRGLNVQCWSLQSLPFLTHSPMVTVTRPSQWDPTVDFLRGGWVTRCSTITQARWGVCEKKTPSGMIFIVGHASWIYLGYSEWSWILKSQSTDASGWVQWRFKLGSP